MQTLRFVILVLALLLPSQSFAKMTHSWLVAKVTGKAYIAQKNKKAERVRKGMKLHPGQTLSTRSRSRVLLKRNKERMQVGPASVIAIPAAEYNKPGKTLILQQSGHLQLVAQARDVKHFSVRTPYLAAIVKGTTFSVEVHEGRAEVKVTSGRVEVSNTSTGETTHITRGQSASVQKTRSGKSALTVNAPGKKVSIRKIKKKIGKPNFYAVVKKKGKTLALKPGSSKATASVAKVKAETVAIKKSGWKSRRAMTKAERKAAREANKAERLAATAASVEANPNATAEEVSRAQEAASQAAESAQEAATEAAETNQSSPGNSNGAGNSENSNAGGNSSNSGASGASSSSDNDDGNNGNGNDADGSDSSNPGNSSSSSSSNDDDGNNGHGNDADGSDSSNPGNSGNSNAGGNGNGNSGNNGNGNGS